MAESIFLRVRRLVSGSIEDTVDAMERANSDSTMREAIREIDRAIDEVKADLEKAMTRRLQAARQQGLIAKRVEELTGKAKFALREQREDLAEGALARQVDLEQQVGGLETVQANSRTEEGKFEESLAALRSRKKELEEALAAFTIARTEATMGGDGDFENSRNVERKVERAEAAFNRAMTGAGGIAVDRGSVEAINKIAEIDSMVKSQTVAERLAALKREVSQAA
jgi:phage shock protein A